jgi:23S rRNA (guanine1835-N2)-methyltransferase
LKEKNTYKFDRFDLSEDRSLRPWSAADELMLEHLSERKKAPGKMAVYNDRFGYLTCHLIHLTPHVVLTQKSQEKAILANLKQNELEVPSFVHPLEKLKGKLDFGLIKIPKSVQLFELFLEHFAQNSKVGATAVCSFMTRHFNASMIKVAEDYFEVVEQSQAKKKARLLILTKKKKTTKKEVINTLSFNNQEYKQYFGVFSSDHIDYATQFLVEHLQCKDTDQCVLDLASGNGIIAKEILMKFPEVELHLMDDSNLAVESAKLNLQGENVYHHFDNNLVPFPSKHFDLIVTNPPYHFEHEINIQIPLALFKEAQRCLKVGGSLQLVASQHLNYKTHLVKIFKEVEIVAEDKKFVVYNCIK